jgi:hypothetical protein
VKLLKTASSRKGEIQLGKESRHFEHSAAGGRKT